MSRQEHIEKLLDNLGRFKRVMHGGFQHACDKLGLSPAQFEALQMIYHGQPLPPKELAKKLSLTPGAVSQLLESLSAAGMIERSHSATDRRVQYVSLSQDGKHRLDTFQASRRQLLTESFDALSDHELTTYIKVQEKLLNWYEQNQPKGKTHGA